MSNANESELEGTNPNTAPNPFSRSNQVGVMTYVRELENKVRAYQTDMDRAVGVQVRQEVIYQVGIIKIKIFLGGMVVGGGMIGGLIWMITRN